jgi:hypothetical protein
VAFEEASGHVARLLAADWPNERRDRLGQVIVRNRTVGVTA